MSEQPKQPEKPLGPRDLDLSALNDKDFEQLCHLLVLIEFPESIHVANPDGGADSVLPEASGGYSRGWQAKRYTNNIYYGKCEESLDAAIKNYAVTHYTFMFARDLTGGQEKSFAARLRSRHPGVTVDYWDKSKLISILLTSQEGKAIANHFYGDPKADTERFGLALRAGAAPIDSAAEALERLGAIAKWLRLNDPYFGYPISARPGALGPPAPWPGSVAAVEVSDGETVQRMEAVPLNSEAMEKFGPSARLEFDPGPEGQRALEALNEAVRTGGVVELEEGAARLIFDRLPPAFQPFLEGDEGRGRIVLTAPKPAPAPWAATFVIRSERGEEQLDVDLQPAVPPEGWDGALEGTVGGLKVTALFRSHDGGGQLGLTWHYESKSELGIYEQARTLAAVDGLHGPGTLLIRDRVGQRPELTMTVERREPPEFLAPTRQALGWMIEMSEWLGRELPWPSDGFTMDDFRTLARAADIVRHGGSEMTFDEVSLQFPQEAWEHHRPIIEAGGPALLRLPVPLPQFGLELGVLVGELPGLKIISTETVIGPTGEEIAVKLGPVDDASRHPFFRLDRV